MIVLWVGVGWISCFGCWVIYEFGLYGDVGYLVGFGCVCVLAGGVLGSEYLGLVMIIEFWIFRLCSFFGQVVVRS
jgi:hypothetical protein